MSEQPVVPISQASSMAAAESDLPSPLGTLDVSANLTPSIGEQQETDMEGK